MAHDDGREALRGKDHQEEEIEDEVRVVPGPGATLPGLAARGAADVARW